MKEDIIENLRMAAPGDPWWWIKLLLPLVVLAGLGFLYFLRLRRAGRLPFQRPPVPPGRSALERLAAIRHLIDEGLVREFVREASGILRDYIEARFGLCAPRLSTEEFLFEAGQSALLDEAARARLAEFLFCCDRVKFALGSLDHSQMEALYASAEHFVKETAPAPAGSAAAEPATEAARP
ncbi:MAG: hypothetical protein WC003_02540 [Terrimicrobiaceae bacterium]